MTGFRVTPQTPLVDFTQSLLSFIAIVHCPVSLSLPRFHSIPFSSFPLKRFSFLGFSAPRRSGPPHSSRIKSSAVLLENLVQGRQKKQSAKYNSAYRYSTLLASRKNISYSIPSLSDCQPFEFHQLFSYQAKYRRRKFIHTKKWGRSEKNSLLLGLRGRKSDNTRRREKKGRERVLELLHIDHTTRTVFTLKIPFYYYSNFFRFVFSIFIKAWIGFLDDVASTS